MKKLLDTLKFPKLYFLIGYPNFPISKIYRNKNRRTFREHGFSSARGHTKNS
ncbi:hypothetical protein LEP1GSC060_3035 [Leptospira weilii serovar Ranarum str. ICFT]|uniref:Uncharacterized protein n=1 Tax=Leptospira weilii serovar Ranarum str. ICFT TaxID=1218598 RepID=N1WJ86_9LEPT|nr:hypothetical protein LEP1GSC060_3035 [Leptospira weilii serovar Ranarum str. ICFT]